MSDKTFQEAALELSRAVRGLGDNLADVLRLPQIVAWLNRKLS